MTRTPPPTPLTRANQALATSRALRAEWLVGIAEGLVTPLDLLLAATEPDGKPLRPLRLRTVLLAQPGWGETRTRAALARLRDFTNTPTDRTLTVGWVIDKRARGRRLAAWVDALETDRNQPPWPGFPWTTPPPTITHPPTTTSR